MQSGKLPVRKDLNNQIPKTANGDRASEICKISQGNLHNPHDSRVRIVILNKLEGVFGKYVNGIWDMAVCLDQHLFGNSF